MARVKQVNPCCLFYGEGWKVDSDVTKKEAVLAGQETSALTPVLDFSMTPFGTESGEACLMLPRWLAGRERGVCPPTEGLHPGQRLVVPSAGPSHQFCFLPRQPDPLGKTGPGVFGSVSGISSGRQRAGSGHGVFSQGMPFLLAGKSCFWPKRMATEDMTPTAITSPTAATEFPGPVCPSRKYGKTGIFTGT